MGKLNSPNDLVCKSDGSIWFTDPQYGIKSNYEGYKSESELGFNGVYKIDKQNNVILLTKEIDGPNGIAFSPDEKILYVTDTETTGNIFHLRLIKKIFMKKKCLLNQDLENQMELRLMNLVMSFPLLGMEFKFFLLQVI